MNVFTFTGRIGNDAEVRSTQNGTKVAGFNVANDIGFGDNKKTQWVSCSLWGERGEKLAQYLTKGKQVTVTGEVSIREWQDNAGNSRASLQVRVNDVALQGDTGQGKAAPAEGTAKAASTPAAKPAAPAAKPVSNTAPFDDEIPF